jgi:hypothetical protein
LSALTRPEPPDMRLVADMTLAQVPSGEQVEAEEGSGIMVPKIITDTALEIVTRRALAACNAVTAQDVKELGCTGLAVHGVTVEDAQATRLGLAGSGVGLTCYVGPDRFCLIHNVIGGLQEHQEQRHAHAVMQISRELTAEERAHVAVMETARRAPKHDARDALTGHRVADKFLQEVTGVIAGPQAPADPLAPAEPAASAPAPAPVPAPAALAFGREFLTAGAPNIHFQCPACDAVYPWPVPGLSPELQPKTRRCTRCFAAPDDAEVRFTCPDHTETAWHCRFCVAVELVRGVLSPTFLMGHAEVGTTIAMDDMQAFDGDDVTKRLVKFEEAGVSGAVLYVKVARWTRKLARG